MKKHNTTSLRCQPNPNNKLQTTEVHFLLKKKKLVKNYVEYMKIVEDKGLKNS